jgi:hypothetical protein
LLHEIELNYNSAVKFSMTKQDRIQKNGFLNEAYILKNERFRDLLLPFLPAGRQIELEQRRQLLELEEQMEREGIERANFAQQVLHPEEEEPGSPPNRKRRKITGESVTHGTLFFYWLIEFAVD